MAPSTRKFSIYLLREGYDLSRATLRISKNSIVEDLPKSSSLPFPHQGFVVRNKASKPRWAATLADHFPLEDLSNQTSSVVLLFEASARTWALCYGNGFHLIGPGAMEPGFGLRVVANSVDPKAIKSADSRRPDVITRTTRTQASAGSTIADLGVAVDRELIKHLAGAPISADDTESVARRLAGADSLQVNATWEMPDLADHASRLLELFESDTYKAEFGFIDNFRPLPTGDPLIEQLDQAVAERIDARSHERLALAAPEVLDEDRFDHFELAQSGKKRELVELRLSELYETLDDFETTGEIALKRMMIIAVDGDGSPASTRRPLKKYIAAEVEHDEAMYMLVAGQWFSANDGFVQNVNKRVSDLVNGSQVHPLPDWPAGHDEGAYNSLAGATKDWTSIDKELIYHGGRHQKIEFGDLVSKNSTAVVHVKKMSSSATLSHLWAQGAVAAQLYKSDPEFREKAQKLEASLPDDMTEIRLVYAVANDRSGDLADELFFFSKVHLLQQIDVLKLIACPVDLVKIQIT